MELPLDYDDANELEKYIRRNFQQFMTPFEQRAKRLGFLRESGRAQLNVNPQSKSTWKPSSMERYESEADDEVRRAIGDMLESFMSFQHQVSARIRRAFWHGYLTPNRCPACSRIVISPLARQCLWCGHDWHLN